MVAFQDIQIIYGEISDDTWEEMMLVVRRTLHGIGETSKQGSTYGWQQQFKNIGFRHISLTPKNGYTVYWILPSINIHQQHYQGCYYHGHQ